MYARFYFIFEYGRGVAHGRVYRTRDSVIDVLVFALVGPLTFSTIAVGLCVCVSARLIVSRGVESSAGNSRLTKLIVDELQ